MNTELMKTIEATYPAGRVIVISIRDVYGTPKAYPENEAAMTLAELAGTKTLTRKTLQLAKKLGFTIHTMSRAYAMCDIE